MSERKLRVTRAAADRDPMFAAIWYDGAELTVSATPQPEPLTLLPLPPEPSQEALRWKAALEQAGVVTTLLKAEPDFDGELLISVVADLLEQDPIASDIIEAYRRRKET